MSSDDLERLTRAYKLGNLSDAEYALLVSRLGTGGVEEVSSDTLTAETPIPTEVGAIRQPFAASPSKYDSDSSDRLQLGLFVARISCSILIMLGSITPWASILFLSIKGTDTRWGWVTLGAGAISLVFLLRTQIASRIALGASVIAFITAGYFFTRMLFASHTTKIFGETIRTSIAPGVGLWLIVIGGAAAIGLHAFSPKKMQGSSSAPLPQGAETMPIPSKRTGYILLGVSAGLFLVAALLVIPMMLNRGGYKSDYLPRGALIENCTHPRDLSATHTCSVEKNLSTGERYAEAVSPSSVTPSWCKSKWTEALVKESDRYVVRYGKRVYSYHDCGFVPRKRLHNAELAIALAVSSSIGGGVILIANKRRRTAPTPQQP